MLGFGDRIGRRLPLVLSFGSKMIPTQGGLCVH
jgi:hypothetical protein